MPRRRIRGTLSSLVGGKQNKIHDRGPPRVHYDMRSVTLLWFVDDPVAGCGRERCGPRSSGSIVSGSSFTSSTGAPVSRARGWSGRWPSRPPHAPVEGPCRGPREPRQSPVPLRAGACSRQTGRSLDGSSRTCAPTRGPHQRHEYGAGRYLSPCA